MKRPSAAARVRLAQAELAVAQRELAKTARPWRQRLQRHRKAVILMSGFASGLALTLLPPRWWARIGSAAGATAAGAARSAFTPAVVGAVISRLRRGDDANRHTDQPQADQ